MAEKNKKITIYDISEQSGVSIATVSRVLNGASNVNPDTRERVEEVIRKLGYKPNAFARGLGLDTMKTIGILCADSSDAYLSKAVYYIEEQLRENHYDSLLCCTGYDPDGKRKALDLLISKKVDAAILAGSYFLEPTEHGNRYIKEAAGSLPIMMLNATLDYPNVYSVLCDDAGATEKATEYLIGRGCKQILFLYDTNSYSASRKMAGFMSAYEKRHEQPAKELIQFSSSGRYDFAGTQKLLNAIWARGIRFDGVIASEDALAIAALKFAKETGLKCPDDIKIIGYNNSFFAAATDPEITSVDNKLHPLCRQLVDTLMGVLSGKNMAAKSEFTGEIIFRGTT